MSCSLYYTQAHRGAFSIIAVTIGFLIRIRLQLDFHQIDDVILYALQGTNITETKILQSACSKVGPVMKHGAFKAKTLVGLSQGGQMGLSHCAIVMLIMTSNT